MGETASGGGDERGRDGEGKERRRQGDERELMMKMSGGCDTVSGVRRGKEKGGMRSNERHGKSEGERELECKGASEGKKE